MRGGDAKTGLKTTDFALVIKSGNRHKYVQNSVRFLREHNRKKGITNNNSNNSNTSVVKIYA